jgi:hypothetical protein
MELPEFDLSDDHAAAFCPACGAGYTAGRARCADCDRELLSRAEVEAKLAEAGDALEEPSPDEPELDETAGEPPEFDLSDPDAVAFCPSCGSGYRAGTIRCWDCDSELVPRSSVEARANQPHLERESDEPVPLSDLTNSYRAHVLGSLLNDEGIWFATETSTWGAVRFLVRPAISTSRATCYPIWTSFRTLRRDPEWRLSEGPRIIHRHLFKNSA